MPPQKRQRPTKNTADLDARIKAFHEKKRQAKALSEAIAEDQAAILDMMGGEVGAEHKVDGLKAKIVQATSIVVDEQALRKRVGAAMWNKITTRILDRKKLDAYLATGELKPTTIAAVSTEKENAPYVKITQD